LATIPDGSYSEYYYKITIKPNFPQNLMGKVYEIGVSTNEEMTNSYGSVLVIPSIKLGIPYGVEHD